MRYILPCDFGRTIITGFFFSLCARYVSSTQTRLYGDTSSRALSKAPRVASPGDKHNNNKKLYIKCLNKFCFFLDNIKKNKSEFVVNVVLVGVFWGASEANAKMRVCEFTRCHFSSVGRYNGEVMRAKNLVLSHVSSELPDLLHCLCDAYVLVVEVGQAGDGPGQEKLVGEVGDLLGRAVHVVGDHLCGWV